MNDSREQSSLPADGNAGFRRQRRYGCSFADGYSGVCSRLRYGQLSYGAVQYPEAYARRFDGNLLEIAIQYNVLACRRFSQYGNASKSFARGAVRLFQL